MANATCGERRALVKRICDWVLTHCDPNKDSIVLTDAQGTQLGGGSNAILAVTDAWCNLCGYTEAEAVGQSPRLTQGVGTDLSCIAGMREAIAQGRACKVSIVNYRKGGDAFINNLTLCPIRLHGEVVVYTGILKDYSSALSRMVTLRPTQYFKMTPHYTFARGLIARPPSMPMIMDVEDDLTVRAASVRPLATRPAAPPPAPPTHACVALSPWICSRADRLGYCRRRGLEALRRPAPREAALARAARA
jgi:PAS domain S-box-containing protein